MDFPWDSTWSNFSGLFIFSFSFLFSHRLLPFEAASFSFGENALPLLPKFQSQDVVFPSIRAWKRSVPTQDRLTSWPWSFDSHLTLIFFGRFRFGIVERRREEEEYHMLYCKGGSLPATTMRLYFVVQFMSKREPGNNPSQKVVDCDSSFMYVIT